ncbi:hypothetical protein Q4R67_07555 [Morganella morganii]
MFGLDNKSGINVMPPIAPADSQTPLWFTEGGAGLSATYPGQDWFNQIQAELLNVLKAADIAPQKGNLSQLSSAISKLASAYAVLIVHTTGDSLTSVMSQKSVTDLTDKKFNISDIVSEIGYSNDKVMDQRIVTNKLNEKIDKSSIVHDLGNREDAVVSQYGVKKAIAAIIPVGMFSQFPHRATHLPSGWYSTNGDRFAVTSAPGIVLKSLPAELKSDWGIVESGGMINIPNIRQADGRTPFLRPTNGTDRLPGSVVSDYIRDIQGIFESEDPWALAWFGGLTANGVFTVGSTSRRRAFTEDKIQQSPSSISFIASKVVPTGPENKPLDIGVTLAMYLGV